MTAVLIPTFSGIIEEARKSAILQEAINEYKMFYSEDMSDGVLDGQPAIEGSGYYIYKGPTKNEALYEKEFGKYLVIYDGEKWSIVVGGGSNLGGGSETNPGVETVEKIFTLSQTNEGEYIITGLQSGVKASKIKNLVIPETIDDINVVQIGSHAFYCRREIESVKIPKTIQEIGDQAFAGCTSLITIILDTSSPYFKLDRGIVYTADYKEIVFCAAGKDSTKLIIPDTVTKIRAGAFSECVKLQTVEIPGSVKEIGRSAFYGCTDLSTLVLSEGIEKIDNYAFQYCMSLQNLVIPASLTEIGETPFNMCILVETLTITNIGRGTAVGNVKDLFYYLEDDADKFPQRLDTVVIAEGATRIGNSAFSSWDKLKHVTLPSTLKTIDSSAFQECINLQELTIPNGVETIAQDAFRLCESLKTITIPVSVTTIGPSAFYYCDGLETIIIEGDSVEIGSEAFYMSENL